MHPLRKLLSVIRKQNLQNVPPFPQKGRSRESRSHAKAPAIVARERERPLLPSEKGHKFVITSIGGRRRTVFVPRKGNGVAIDIVRTEEETDILLQPVALA